MSCGAHKICCVSRVEALDYLFISELIVYLKLVFSVRLVPWLFWVDALVEVGASVALRWCSLHELFLFAWVVAHLCKWIGAQILNEHIYAKFFTHKDFRKFCVLVSMFCVLCFKRFHEFLKFWKVSNTDSSTLSVFSVCSSTTRQDNNFLLVLVQNWYNMNFVPCWMLT